MSEIEPVVTLSDSVEPTVEQREEVPLVAASDAPHQLLNGTMKEDVNSAPSTVNVSLKNATEDVQSTVMDVEALQDEAPVEDISSLEEHPDNVHQIHLPVEEVASMSIDQIDAPVSTLDEVDASIDVPMVDIAADVTISVEESAGQEPTSVAEDASKDETPASAAVDAETSFEQEKSTKPKKLSGKQRKALKKRLVAHSASTADGLTPLSVVDKPETVEELRSPEEQHRAARLAKAGAEGSESSAEVVKEEVQVPKKKKPTSAERRAIRDAKRAAADTASSANVDAAVVPAEEEKTIVEVPVVAASTASSSSDVSVTKKLGSKQRKARAKGKRAAAQTELHVGSVTAESAAAVQTTAVTSSSQPSLVNMPEEKSEKKKLGSRERKALKLAREAAEGESSTAGKTDAINVTPVASQAQPVTTPAVESKKATAAEDGSDATPTKTRKLNSKQRKAKKRAAEIAAQTAAEVEAAQAAAVAAATLAALATAPVVEKNKTDKKQKPAKAVVETTAGKTVAVSAKEAKAGDVTAKEAKIGVAPTTKDVPSKPAANTGTDSKTRNKAESKADNKDGKKTLADSPPVGPPLSSVATIALHGTLAALRQGLLSRDSVIYTQQSAMKMHLLTEVCKLGYECVEGGASNFQYLSWSASGHCLNYTSAVVNAPQQYPVNLKSKGDLKIAAPALSLRLKCYPAFGAGSPALLGIKSFREGFIRSVLEVKLGQTDGFVFVMPLQVYIDYAWEAMGSLPAVRDIKRHFGEYGAAYGLRALCCTVETAYGEFIIGCVVVA